MWAGGKRWGLADNTYSRRPKNGDVFVPFHPVETKVKPCTRMETGQAEATRWKMRSAIPIISSTKMTPQEPKKAKRSIALSKRSQLEAIRVDWQHKIDRSSIADFEPMQSSLDRLNGWNRSITFLTATVTRQY